MCIVLYVGLFVCIFIAVSAQTGDQMLGKGTWRVLNIMGCEDEDRYPYKFEVTRKKLNRTHDGFNGYIKFDDCVNEDSFAIRIDICKFVDGGCKPYQVMADDSFCRFINKYAQANVEKAFTMAGVDPPNCPFPGGEFQIEHYIFDYSELPQDGVYGMFGAKTVLIKDDVEIGCIDAVLEFKENEEEDEEE